MTSTASQTRACSEPACWAAFQTCWGWLAAVRSAQGLTGLTMPQRTKAEAVGTIETAGLRRDPGAFGKLGQQLAAYFDGRQVEFAIDVDLGALPPFFARVLHAARMIPYGETATYADVARLAGHAKAARAVGQAMARNPVPIVVPCHRVVASTGLGGFSAPEGLDLKRRLLALEGNRVCES